MRKGVKNTLSVLSLGSSAFILPKYTHDECLRCTNTKRTCLIRFLTLLGFIGMLRPHIFKQLHAGSFRMVSGSGAVIPLPRDRRSAQRVLYQLKAHSEILGFYIRFESKTMRDAKAYFPTLCTTSPTFVPMCPTSALLEIVGKGG